MPKCCARTQGQTVFTHSQKPGEVEKVLHEYESLMYPRKGYKSRARARSTYRSTSMEKRSYQYNKFFYIIVTNTLTTYLKVPYYI